MGGFTRLESEWLLAEEWGRLGTMEGKVDRTGRKLAGSVEQPGWLVPVEARQGGDHVRGARTVGIAGRRRPVCRAEWIPVCGGRVVCLRGRVPERGGKGIQGDRRVRGEGRQTLWVGPGRKHGFAGGKRGTGDDSFFDGRRSAGVRRGAAGAAERVQKTQQIDRVLSGLGGL